MTSSPKLWVIAALVLVVLLGAQAKPWGAPTAVWPSFTFWSQMDDSEQVTSEELKELQTLIVALRILTKDMYSSESQEELSGRDDVYDRYNPDVEWVPDFVWDSEKGTHRQPQPEYELDQVNHLNPILSNEILSEDSKPRSKRGVLDDFTRTQASNSQFGRMGNSRQDQIRDFLDELDRQTPTHTSHRREGGYVVDLAKGETPSYNYNTRGYSNSNSRPSSTSSGSSSGGIWKKIGQTISSSYNTAKETVQTFSSKSKKISS